MLDRQQTEPHSRRNLLLTISAIALTATLAFAAGWHARPTELLEGYAFGNQDGYSTGYNDGTNHNPPDPHRGMKQQDYDLRTSLGGRPIGQ